MHCKLYLTTALSLSVMAAPRLPALEDCDSPGDDDLDGRINCADPDCSSSPGCGTETDCSDRLDNDLDGRVDCDDCDCLNEPSCLPPMEGNFSDGLSDDCDDLADCEDPDCAFSSGCTREFRRGDANGDGKRNVSDAIVSLQHLFHGQAAPCRDALDTDDNGAIDISDPIRLLLYVFAHGSEPPQPFPGCGGDPTREALDCLSATACSV